MTDSRSALCSQASADLTWDSNELDSPSAGNVKRMNIARKSSEKTGRMSHAIQTLQAWMEQDSLESMLSPAGSPVKTSQQPIQAGEGSTGPDLGCSSSLCGSFARYDPATSSWRTFQCSLAGGLIEFSESWPPAGMMRNGTSSARPASGRSIDVIGCSFWPTPTVVDSRDRKWYGTTGQHGIALPGAVALFPTPRSRSMCGGMGAAQMIDRLRGHGKITDSERTAMRSGNGGKLNPTWVEWLMGFPPGWTDLESSETPSCLKSGNISVGSSSSMIGEA